MANCCKATFRTARLGCGLPFLVGLWAAAIVLSSGNASLAQQDWQIVAVGNGFADSECVLPGLDGILDSTPVNDDEINASRIISGADGICDTPLEGDDERSPNGAALGQGLPGGMIIKPGGPGGPDYVCDHDFEALGDDVILVEGGISKPYQLCVGPGPNGTIESSAVGDDVPTAVICPGIDGQHQSVPDPADEFPANSDLCDACIGSSSCIIPGNDGVLQTAADPADDLMPVILSGPDGICQSDAAASDDTQMIVLGQGFDRTFCVSSGPDGIAQTTLCGNGTADYEENGINGDAECDDGNTDSGDGCSDICQPEFFCGNGIVEGGEECDDGNTRNNDACVLGCKNAFCGDGIRHRGVEECEPPNTATCDENCLAIEVPGCGDGIVDSPDEECDDSNSSNRDNCLNNCLNAFCGDGFIHTKGSGPFEECDDGNTTSGDGCSAGCAEECGNEVIDGGCSEGNVGADCSTDEDCDTGPTEDDGVCVGETCDPGEANLCVPGPTMCSNVCQTAGCGNGEVECDEECDLGPNNGVLGSGCQADCTRNLVGRRELIGKRECWISWTLDQPPRDPVKKSQKCTDGDVCDFDAIAGQCTFRVGVCLNRLGSAACTPGGLVSVDLRLKVDRPDQAAAAEVITAAIAALAPAAANVPDRCIKGLKRKSCSFDHECETSFGKGDGKCDLGTGVRFEPPLDPGDQVATCSPGVDIVVAAGKRLKLPVLVRNTSGRRDRDSVRLICKNP